MSMKRIYLVVIIAVFALILTACSGSGAVNSWSNALLTEDMIYYAGASQVYALRAENGNVAWQYPEKASATRLFFAEPVLVDDQLIVGDYGNLLTSLDPLDGSQNWQFEGAKGRYIDSPLIVGETIVAPNADYNIYALDFSGNKKWTFKGGHAFWARPVSDGATIFAGSLDHFLYGIDLSSGNQKWKTDLKASIVARALLEETGTLYIGTLDGDLFAISSTNGTILWQQKVGGGVWSAPLLNDGKLYFGDQNGNLNILDAESGKIIQTVETDAAILGSGMVLEDGIAFGNENGELIKFGFEGEKIWTRSIDGKLYANLQMNGERLIVIATDGEKPLVALDANGNENWYFSTKK